MKPNSLADDLTGLKQLSHEGFMGVANVTESMHQSIFSVGGLLNKNQQTGGLTGFIYRSVRFVAKSGFHSADWAIQQLSPLLPDVSQSQRRLRWLSMLNGVLGDHLLATDNPLALPMAIVNDQAECTIHQAAERWSDASKKPLLMVHGLCLSEQCWQAPGRHGEMLKKLGYYAHLYLRYNSGLAISDNGCQLSVLLNQISAQMPAGQTLDIVTHSMGGLVVRSALHTAQVAGHNWPDRVNKLIFLGTPHHGAYLEKAGYIAHYLMTISPFSRPFANIAKRRSQGIQDLNSGRITDQGRAMAIPSHIKAHAIASKLRHKKNSKAEHWLGDGLVSVASALGEHHKPHRHLNIPKDRQWTVPDVSHMGLLFDVAVQKQLLTILD